MAFFRLLDLHLYAHFDILKLQPSPVFPKLCAAEEAEVGRESFVFWQNLILQILRKVGFRKVCEK